MILTIDLTSFLLVWLSIPTTIFLTVLAYNWAMDIRPLQQNKYISKLIKENNEIWREYLELQGEFKKIQDEKKELNND